MEHRVSTAEIVDLPLLRGISHADLSWMLDQCDVICLDKGQTLLSPDKDNDTIYIVLRGKLAVEFEPNKGGMRTYIDEGGWVGEMSVIDNVRPSAKVVTHTDSKLLAVHARTWWDLIDRSHIAARNFLHALSYRLRQNNELIAEGMQKQHIFSEKAQTDSLTGLRNRRWLEEKLPDILRSRNTGLSNCSILMMDIDHFKKFNDQYGHLAGDRVLQTVADVVRDNLREGDAAIRYGGEELIIVFPETNSHAAVHVAERLRSFIRETRVDLTEGRVLPPVTVSIGVYTIQTGDTPEKVLGRVDAALYQAKNAGRDQVAVWQAE